MRTIGKRHPRRALKGDYREVCFECNAPDLRSKLIRLADGRLYHRSGTCRPSKTAIELDRGNAAGARRVRPQQERGGSSGSHFINATEVDNS